MLLSIVQLSRFLLRFVHLRQLIYFIISISLCQELFLKFFIFLTSSLYFSESAHLYYHVFFRKSRTFLKFFYFLFTWSLTFFKIRRSRQTSVIPLFWFKLNGERGIWTLAPVTRPTPLAGAPLQPLEYFSVHWILL